MLPLMFNHSTGFEMFRNSREPLEFCCDKHYCFKNFATGKPFFIRKRKSKNWGENVGVGEVGLHFI